LVPAARITTGHRRTEGFFAADRQYGHCQPAGGDKRLVVGGVLIEGLELFEAGVHRAGPGIERGVMLARLFVEILGIGGEFVPEAVEIDPLAAFHQPFRIRSVEREMPQRVIADDVVPRTDAGQRRVDQDELADAIGMLGRVREGDGGTLRHAE
jgi:hypothetical protein